MNPTNYKTDDNATVRLFAFYTSFFLGGLIASYWYGIGWFIFSHAIRSFLVSMPIISVQVMRIVAGHDFANKLEEKRKFRTGAQKFISVYIVNAVNIVLTIFTFWKVNISIQQILLLLSSH